MEKKMILGLIALLAFAVLLAGCNYTLSDFQQTQGQQANNAADNNASGIPMPNAEGIGESIPNLPI
jgi:hypothetical protein